MAVNFLMKVSVLFNKVEGQESILSTSWKKVLTMICGEIGLEAVWKYGVGHAGDRTTPDVRWNQMQGTNAKCVRFFVRWRRKVRRKTMVEEKRKKKRLGFWHTLDWCQKDSFYIDSWQRPTARKIWEDHSCEKMFGFHCGGIVVDRGWKEIVRARFGLRRRRWRGDRIGESAMSDRGKKETGKCTYLPL